jgi:hypothetical protein
MKDEIYYQRAIAIQKKEIIRQKKRLDRIERVYMRDIYSTSIKEAMEFLVKIIIKKIKR